VLVDSHHHRKANSPHGVYIDRKKDLIKLGDGEYISLGRIETTLLTNEYIDNICVYGDCEHDYLLALVVPNKKNLEALAERIGVAKSWEKLCQDKGVRRALLSELQEFSKEKLNRREMPQKLHICAEVWDSDSADKPGMLTETKKLKRKNIAQTYEKQITQLFNEK
jgi:long-chain acyl-CoA synthetase